MPLEVGTIIDGRYKVESLLGEGSMAVVYAIRHRTLGSQHALKVLKIDHDSIRERMIREGQAQAKLAHPNIVSVTDVILVNEDAGLVMEFVDGGSLAELLQKSKLTHEQADMLVTGILKGASAAHQAGYIHRDLKPANILLQRDGRKLIPKITDFGLAKAMDNSNTLTKSGVMMGTPAYMAPEQIQDAKHVDQRADLFSIGAILYHMVVGRRPFDHASIANVLTAVLDGDFPPLSEAAPDLPIHRQKAIEAALEVEPIDRVATAADLLAMWNNEFGVARGGETTEGPFGRELLDSLAAPSQPTRNIADLATVAAPQETVPKKAAKKKPPRKEVSPTAKTFKMELPTPPKQPPRKKLPPPKRSGPSPVTMGIGVVGFLILLSIATVIGFGFGSLLLLSMSG